MQYGDLCAFWGQRGRKWLVANNGAWILKISTVLSQILQ